MIVGKQAVKNDLEALDKKIDSVSEMKAEQVAQIESAVISSGDLFDPKAIGVYYVSDNVSRKPVALNGWQMVARFPAQTAAWNSMFFASNGDVYSQVIHTATPVYTSKFLTTRNTITDANGFIKTA